jgi:3-deoxy-7-phosphoheptulonate synthase
LTHAVLRGAVDPHGVTVPIIMKTSFGLRRHKKRGLVNPAIIVDTNHANSNKKFAEQPRIAM